LAADFSHKTRLDLPMPGHARQAVIGGVVNGPVLCPFSLEAAPVLPKVLHELLPLHRSAP
jgi:hypothetical protein